MIRKSSIPAILLLVISGLAVSQDRTVTASIEPKEAYIETRGAERRLNFDLLLHNAGTQPLRISKIQVSVYDSQGALAFRRYLDENGVPCGICTLPERVVPANGSLDVFNPFHTFPSEMPLNRLHYEVLFESLDEKQPNLLRFVSQAEADVYPTPYPGKTNLVLPLHGRIYVFDGHDFYSHHRRQDVFRGGRFRPNSVRYSYDLMTMDAGRNLYHGDQFRKENWLCYGAPVFAPAAGTVVEAVNDIPENSYRDRHVVSAEVPVDPGGLGNHVTIDHANGEFSILLHMKPGSVTVKKGEHVSQGQQIGAIGFSGDTFLPHLDYTVMDGPDERTSRGLPSYFSDFRRVLGTKMESVSRGQIDSGDILEYSGGR
jgi:Peptidase family M23